MLTRAALYVFACKTKNVHTFGFCQKCFCLFFWSDSQQIEAKRRKRSKTNYCTIAGITPPASCHAVAAATAVMSWIWLPEKVDIRNCSRLRSLRWPRLLSWHFCCRVARASVAGRELMKREVPLLTECQQPHGCFGREDPRSQDETAS